MVTVDFSVLAGVPVLWAFGAGVLLGFLGCLFFIRSVMD